MAGKEWFHRFMARHPTLSVRSPLGTSLARIDGFNRDAVKTFFAIYKDVLSEGQFTTNRIWNCDETGFSNVVEPGKVVCTKGTRQIRKATGGERGKNVTALCAYNAAGGYVPLLFVFPRKRMAPGLMTGAPAGSVGYVNTRGRGYIDGQVFLKWLQHFVNTTNCSLTSTQLIILDGHESRQPQVLRSYRFLQRKWHHNDIPASPYHTSPSTTGPYVLQNAEGQLQTCH